MNSKANDKKPRQETHDVYVGHLPKVIKQERLKKVFSRYGEIVDVFCRHGNAPLGYAIIKFRFKEDKERVLSEVDKVHVDGYDMEVKCGKKNSQSDENANETYGKMVSFSQPAPRGNLHMAESNTPNKDSKFKHRPQIEINGHQMQVVEIICTNVDSSVTFQGCSVYRYEELTNISLKLNSICPNLVRLNRKPLMKRVYGALYEDFRWYRCFVRQVMIPSKPGVCIVEYIDYGNIAEVFYSSMVDLPEPIQKISPFAIKCVLSNLMCSPYCNTEVSYLHHLVNKRVTLSAVLKSYSTFGVPEYHVHKCSSNGIDVVSELVRNGYAVYRSHLSHPLQNSNNPVLTKSLEKNESCNNHPNHSVPFDKPKKVCTNKAQSKKASVKEACNGGVKKISGEASNTSVDETAKCSNSSTPNDSQPTENSVPKRIMKRGCDKSDVTSVPMLEGTKTVNHLLKVDCVLANLKLVNNMRNLVSFPADDSLIDEAVNLLLNERTETVSQDKKNLLETAHKCYTEALNDIKDCLDEEKLPDLKEKRTEKKTELLSALKEFFDGFDCSLLDKRKKIQELITALESNSNAWMNVSLSSLPETIEQLVTEYHKERELRWDNIQKARENTNEKHAKFVEILDDFKEEFALNKLDSNSNSLYKLDKSGGKRGSYALKFEEALCDLGTALENEMKTCSVTKGKSHVPIIKCILEKLDVPKERIDNECELYLRYKSMYDDLNNLADIEALFDELASVQENMRSVSFDCIEDEQKLQQSFSELHKNLLHEDAILTELVKASSMHFPELILERPELLLREYKNNWYLLKSSWQIQYFPVIQSCNRIEKAYISRFAEENVVIKEFDIGCESEKKSLIKKAIVWNEIKSKFLVNITALFNKEETGACGVFSQVWKTLSENPLPVPVDVRVACDVLIQVLRGLADIHERGMAHGAVHPMAVLHQDGKVLLDFNYEKKSLQDYCLKGINFRDPSGEDIYKATDMYRFGCLVLWVLFPNLSFTSDDVGVPNILAFQSIIQDLLSDEDFTDLSNLLNPNYCLRPTAKDLTKRGFLKDLKIIPKSEP